jgi:hypothetical protein
VISKVVQILGVEFQKVFLITRTIFSHSRLGQFWSQNTISGFSGYFNTVYVKEDFDILLEKTEKNNAYFLSLCVLMREFYLYQQ